MHDVIIIGGGVTGTATFYTLSRYTDVKNVALIEQKEDFGRVTSRKTQNSQTLHFGDIETNYTLEKARQVKKGAELVKRYVERYKSDRLHSKSHKMALAVGPEETDRLRKRTKEFQTLFPENKLITRDEIKKKEPWLVKGRDPKTPMLAFYSPDGYAINYGALSKSFAKRAAKPGYECRLNTRVKRITPRKRGYRVETNREVLDAKVVLVAAGPHSLTFAHGLGYAKHLALLPASANFYLSPRRVNGKVYMMQDPRVPFAAPHADPEVDDPETTRYGPVPKVILLMERRNLRTLGEFLRLFGLRPKAHLALLSLIIRPVYLKLLYQQLLYGLPWLGRRAYLREARKIIPSLQASELEYAKGFGGVRPQILDTNKRELTIGEAKITGKHILFDITPSPGASMCLKNGADNALYAVKEVNGRFNRTKYKKDFGVNP